MSDPIPDDDPAAMFEGMKKKKKKRATKTEEPVESPETEATPATPETTTETAPEPTIVSTTTSTDAPAESFDFGPKKKKGGKKRPDFAEFEKMMRDEESAAAAGGGETSSNSGGVAIAGDSTGPTDAASGAEIQKDGAQATADEPWLGSNRDYTYEELLMRVFKIIKLQNPDSAGGQTKYKIPPPQVLREGTKKTAFVNVVELSKKMKREPDHLIQYLFSELGTTGSIDGSQRLLIKGRFQQKQIENVLKRYIVEYVTCRTCKSGDTVLSKENRLFFVQCQSCGSTKSVSAIKTGFVAQTGKRSAQRAAAGV